MLISGDCFCQNEQERGLELDEINCNKISIFANPLDTRRRFNVYKTSIRRRRRRIDVL